MGSYSVSWLPPPKIDSWCTLAGGGGGGTLGIEFDTIDVALACISCAELVVVEDGL